MHCHVGVAAQAAVSPELLSRVANVCKKLHEKMIVRTHVGESLAALAELALIPEAPQLGDAGDLAAVQRELTDPRELGQAAWITASFRALACVLRAPDGLRAAVEGLLGEDLDDAASSADGRTLKSTDLGKVLEEVLKTQSAATEGGDTPAFKNLWAAVAWACVAVESQGCRRVLLFPLSGVERRTLKPLISGESLGVDDAWHAAILELPLRSTLRRARLLRMLRRDPARAALDAPCEGPLPNLRYTYDVADANPYHKRPPGPEDDEDRYARWRGEAAEETVEGALASTPHWRRLGAPAVARAGLDVARKASLRGVITDRHVTERNGVRTERKLKVCLPYSEWLAVQIAVLVLFRGTLSHWEILFGRTAYVTVDGSPRNVDGIVRLRSNHAVILVWDYTLLGDPEGAVDYSRKQRRCLKRQEELRKLREAGQLPEPLDKCVGFLVSHIVGNKVCHEALPLGF